MHYLYKITNIINNKIYIGQTRNHKLRWIQHKYESKKGNEKQYIHRAMNKYGMNNFTFEIIDFAFNQWQADCLEINIIKQYDSTDHNKGYNLKSGGSNSPMTNEARAKIAKSMIGNIRFLGKNHSEETKQNMSIIGKQNINGIKALLNFTGYNPRSLGKKHSEEAKQKISLSHAGQKNYNSKLTWELVKQIRQEYQKGNDGYLLLSRKYQVDMKTIANIIKNTTWVDPSYQPPTSRKNNIGKTRKPHEH